MNDITLRIMKLSGSGYCCSQIIMLLALEAQGVENAALVRAMSGLCHGMGDCSGVCGALTGGLCVLGLYVGKGDEEEGAHERRPLMLAELSRWFQEEVGGLYGSIQCSHILDGVECGRPNPERCGPTVAKTFGRCLEILVENGLDPSLPPTMRQDSDHD